jgi:hypothetical protein
MAREYTAPSSCALRGPDVNELFRLIHRRIGVGTRTGFSIFIAKDAKLLLSRVEEETSSIEMLFCSRWTIKSLPLEERGVMVSISYLSLCRRLVFQVGARTRRCLRVLNPSKREEIQKYNFSGPIIGMKLNRKVCYSRGTVILSALHPDRKL